MAPNGQDAFYVLVPVPNNSSNINWSEKGEKFKNLVLDKMDKSVLPGIKRNVTNDFYLTPDYFEKDLATLHGSGFSIQPKFSQSAYFRFHNQSEVFNNLYFVGAGTHPGAGMPGVISSAKVLDKILWWNQKIIYPFTQNHLIGLDFFYQKKSILDVLFYMIFAEQ